MFKMRMISNNTGGGIVMDINQIEKSVSSSIPSKLKLKNIIMAFVWGGCMGVAGQLVLEGYMTALNLSLQQATAPTLMTFIASASLLTGFGVYDRLGQIAGAGLFIPITGFSNSLTSCALESKSEGLIYGIGSNMFKLAGSVLTYGIVASYVLGLVRLVSGL